MRDGSPNKWGHNPIYWDLTKLFLLLNFLYCKMSGVYLDELSPNNQVHDRGWIILYCPIHFYTVTLSKTVFGNFYLKILLLSVAISKPVSQSASVSFQQIELILIECFARVFCLHYNYINGSQIFFYQIMKLICEKLPASDWKYFIAISLIISTFPANNAH